jgi:hypothetical protein
MAGGVDVWAVTGECDRGFVTEDESAAEGERRHVLSLFPLEDWGTLLLERYGPRAGRARRVGADVLPAHGVRHPTPGQY